MKNIILVIAVAALVSTPIWANEVAPTATPAAIQHQTVCPVMGGKINKQQFVDVAGKRIYVCCMGCIGKIKADPDTYIKKIEAAGETVATLQTKCPVMGGKVNKSLYVDDAGQRMYVCCKGCIGPVKKDFAKYAKKLADTGEVLASTPVSPKNAGGQTDRKGHNH
jgi:hypothetical protein